MRDPSTDSHRPSPTQRTASADERSRIITPPKRNRNRPDTTAETTKQESSADFFPQVPYPELGMLFSAGLGWHFLHVAGHPRASRDLGISQEQQQAILKLFVEYWEKYGQIEAQWLKAREKARKLLSEQQNRRVEQVLVLRLGFHAFLRKDIQQFLQLSEEQLAKIQTEIRDHHQRRSRESLRRLGREISQILTPQQRVRFDELRGISSPDSSKKLKKKPI